jgi:hypothetical protein
VLKKRNKRIGPKKYFKNKYLVALVGGNQTKHERVDDIETKSFRNRRHLTPRGAGVTGSSKRYLLPLQLTETLCSLWVSVLPRPHPLPHALKLNWVFIIVSFYFHLTNSAGNVT